MSEERVLGGNTMEDLGVLSEVKEELGEEEGHIGEAMMDFLRRRGNVVGENSGCGGLVPGVEALPGGRVPELLGFSETEIAQVLPSRASGPFVPYLGEARVTIGHGRGELNTRGRSRGNRSRTAGRGGTRRLPMSLSERRRRRRRVAFGSGGPIRLLSNINQEARYRSFPMMRRADARPAIAVNRPRGSVSLFGAGHHYRPVSWHRQRYNESSEGFGKTGRYHPEDARLKATGIFDAICEDLELYKIPPAYWPEPLTFSDFYKSSSSQDSGSPGSFDLCILLFCVKCPISGRLEGRRGVGVE